MVPIAGDPTAYLGINPAIPRLSVRTPLGKNTVPDVTSYRNITANTIYWLDQQWCELSIEGANVKAAYPLLCEIADRVQLASQEFGVAVQGALKEWQALLASKPQLSTEQQTGLFGELLILRHLLLGISADHAISAWRGHGIAEHDFGFVDFDLEVKTTMKESRQHWIASATQLSPSLDRPLWFASIQLTEAGNGGRTLPELVLGIQACLPLPAQIDAFQRKLHAAGWEDDAAPLYSRQLSIRSLPLFFLVDEIFPAIRPEHLISANVQHTRIRELRYVIDLDGLNPNTLPPSTLNHDWEPIS